MENLNKEFKKSVFMDFSSTQFYILMLGNNIGATQLPIITHYLNPS